MSDLVEIKIENCRIFGGGNCLHAEYQLLCMPPSKFLARSHDYNEENNWTVFRRYTEFVKLNKALLQDGIIAKYIGDENVTLPRKLLCGSTLSTISSVLHHRIRRIQIYVNKLLKIPEIYSNAAFILFCDFKNRGASGIVTQVGKEKVLKESIAYSKVEASGNFSLIKFWKTFYLVLLKSGSIFVFESKYDNLDRAVCVISLPNDHVKIIPDFSNKDKCNVTIIAQRTLRKLTIRFDTQLEAAKWTKHASEFSAVEPSFLAESKEVRRSFSEARKLTRSTFNFNNEGGGSSSGDREYSLYAMNTAASGYHVDSNSTAKNKNDSKRGKCPQSAELFML